MISNDELYQALHCLTSKRESSRLRILMELYTSGSAMSQRALVETLLIKPATVSEQLDLLIAAHLVEKHIDMIDKRISIVTLTAEGREEARRLIRDREHRLQKMFHKLSESDKETLYALLKQIQY